MWNRLLLLIGLLLMSACSAEKPTVSIAEEKAVVETSAVKTETNNTLAETDYKTLEQEFYLRINRERDRDKRRDLIDQFAQNFRELALKYPDSTVADEAWSNVLGLGSGPIRIEAMNRHLEIAKAELDSLRSVDLFANVVNFGVNPQKAMALDHLIQTAMLEPATEVSLKGLAELAKSSVIAIEDRSTAIDRLLDFHIDDRIMLDVIQGIGLVNATHNAEVEQWLKAICDQSTGEIQATAAVTLARIIKRRDEQKKFWLGQAAPGADLERQQDRISELPSAYLDYLRTPEDLNEKEQLEKWLTSSLANKDLSGSELQSEAHRYLFAIQNLAVGKQAPEIVGTDLDGVEFKLSDYRGKVVLLTFWADF